jgi:ElaB/YqjD/DUF883 family membrane-anchored ribosome-binding protein
MAMSRNADKARSQAQDALSDLEMQQRIEDLKNELASISKTLSAIGGQKVADYRDTVETMASDAVSASLKALESARVEAMSLEEGFERQVRENPLRAIAIAAGVGFLFALLTRR